MLLMNFLTKFMHNVYAFCVPKPNNFNKPKFKLYRKKIEPIYLEVLLDAQKKAV